MESKKNHKDLEQDKHISAELRERMAARAELDKNKRAVRISNTLVVLTNNSSKANVTRLKERYKVEDVATRKRRTFNAWYSNLSDEDRARYDRAFALLDAKKPVKRIIEDTGVDKYRLTHMAKMLGI